MSLVTVEDLIAYMNGVDFGELQTTAAQLVLDGTQSDLELYLSRNLTQVHVREKVSTDYNGEARLTYSPAQRILSIKPTNGAAVVPTVIVPDALQDTTLFAEEGVRVIDRQPSQMNIVPGGVFIGISRAWFIIEYLAGGFVTPYLPKIKLAILEVASRTMTLNHDDTVGVKGDVLGEVPNYHVVKKGWQEDELKQFDGLRRRTIVGG